MKKPVLLSEEGRHALKSLITEFYEKRNGGWRKKRRADQTSEPYK